MRKTSVHNNMDWALSCLHCRCADSFATGASHPHGTTTSEAATQTATTPALLCLRPRKEPRL